MAEPRPADPMAPRPYRVVQARDEVPEVRTLVLEPADGEPALQAAPGQFAMVYAFGVGEIPLSFSRTDVPGAVVHTIRAVGSVSRALAGLGEGDVVGVRGPFGSAWPLEAAEGRDVVLAAGGLGLAPLRPAILHVLEHRDRYRGVAVLGGARDPETMLYVDALEAWEARGDVEVHLTVDSVYRSSTEDLSWVDDVGVVTNMIPRIGFDLAGAAAFVCGPEVMMRFTVARLQERGLPADRAWLSMERNMECALGHCGHCQLGPHFVCTDGPVLPWERLARLVTVAEV
ncbi:MAG: FAD/NAD(P)-binding protein [Myxococcota bacterium]